MTQANSGDTVRIHYTGTLTDGSTFDSSTGRDPLEFQLGSGQIIPGLDNAIQGMNVGETDKVTIPAAEAYGPHNPDAVQTVPRTDIPAEIDLAPGLTLNAQRPDGQAMPVKVVEVTDTQVTLDANHPLAGEDLTFDVELVAVV